MPSDAKKARDAAKKAAAKGKGRGTTKKEETTEAPQENGTNGVQAQTNGDTADSVDGKQCKSHEYIIIV